MRRKVCLAIIVACLAIAQLYAVKSLDKRELNLTAYKGSYHDFIIRPILGDLNSASGMPFDLTKADVQYVDASSEGGSHTYGRAIAEWSLHSNHTPLKITIDAAPLTRVADSSGAEVSVQSDSDRIDYILFFPYEYNAVDKFLHINRNRSIKRRRLNDVAAKQANLFPATIEDGILNFGNIFLDLKSTCTLYPKTAKNIIVGVRMEDILDRSCADFSFNLIKFKALPHFEESLGSKKLVYFNIGTHEAIAATSSDYRFGNTIDFSINPLKLKFFDADTKEAIC